MFPVNRYIPQPKVDLLRLEYGEITDFYDWEPWYMHDRSTIEYQLEAWKKLEKSIRHRVNKINKSNIQLIIEEVCGDNIIRYRGILIHSIIQAQEKSPFYTHVYAALVSFFNVTLIKIGEYIAKYLISSFRRTYQQNDKINCLIIMKFIAHLINQNILHDIIALEILVFLLENPTNDNVELAIEFLKECGQKLSKVSPKGLDSIFSTLNNLIHQSFLDKHTQYMIEVLFNIRKDEFKSYPAIQPGLVLVDETDQYIHMITLDDPCQLDPILDGFIFDDDYDKNETDYYDNKYLRILHKGRNVPDEKVNEQEKQLETIIDKNETDLLALRRTIYSTIQPRLGVEESANKFLNLNLSPEQEMELCQIILDKCLRRRIYKPFFGLLAQYFCSLKHEYVECFEKMFQNQYEIIHDIECIKLRKIAKFYAHLLVNDAMSWSVLRCIHLTEKGTTSSMRVYIQTLFLELTDSFGLDRLNERLIDPTMREYFRDLFPCDNEKNCRFTKKFFIMIGLGELTNH